MANPKQMADPKLKAAMAEIQTVLHRHDIAGVVHLVSETHSEYLYELAPSWSLIRQCARYVRIRARPEDFETYTARRAAVATTAHLIMQLRELSAQAFGSMQTLIDLLDGQITLKHTPPACTATAQELQQEHFGVRP